MRWSSIAPAAIAALSMPGYLAVEHALPVLLRDRPWPLELVALTAAAIAVAVAVRRRDASAVAWAAVALVGAGWLSLYARAVRFRLPQAPGEFAMGTAEPDFVLADVDGQKVALSSLRGRPVLLVFYKGSWCPFCRKELVRLGREAPPYQAEGVQIVALSSDTPELSARLKRSLELPFRLLSDPDRSVVVRCRASHCLVLLDEAGVVRWAAYTENWRGATPYDRVLQAAVRRP